MVKKGFNRLLVVVTILFLNATSFAQSQEVKHLLDTTILLLKEHSVNARKIDWTKLTNKATADSKQIQSPSGLGPLMRYLFDAVNDFHGSFGYMDSVFKLPLRGIEPSDSVKNEWSKGIGIEVQTVAKGIGYLRIPYMSNEDKEGLDRKAQLLNDSLCALMQNNVRGLIIDLRLNGGGAMFPMILGISALLDTGRIGSFTADKSIWYLRDRNFLLDTTTMATLDSVCIIARNLPVAVLIGAGTGSSGEFLAVALKSRANTKFFGSKTAGYVTSIMGFNLAPSAYVHISTGYGADKNGRIYKQAIRPDVFVDAADSFNDLPNDGKVRAAIKWLSDAAK